MVYHVEFVIDVSESILNNDVFHPHAAVGRGISGHHIRYVGHALHASGHHNVLKTHIHVLLLLEDALPLYPRIERIYKLEQISQRKVKMCHDVFKPNTA